MAFGDPDPEVRLAVLEELVESGHSAALSGLSDLLREFPRTHHRQAARLMRRVKTDKPCSGLLDCLSDPEQRHLRPTVIEVLEELYAPDGTVS